MARTRKPKDTRIQDTEGMASKEAKIQDTEGTTSKEKPVWPGYEDGHTSELEEDNQDPDEPEDKSFQTRIVFEGDFFAVRVDQLSAEQEHDMENGRPYRFMDIESKIPPT